MASQLPVSPSAADPDRQLPGETVNRRTLLRAAALGSATVVVAALAVPALVGFTTVGRLGLAPGPLQ